MHVQVHSETLLIECGLREFYRAGCDSRGLQVSQSATSGKHRDTQDCAQARERRSVVADIHPCTSIRS